mgnify:CR=1 FL=1
MSDEPTARPSTDTIEPAAWRANAVRATTVTSAG